MEEHLRSWLAMSRRARVVTNPESRRAGIYVALGFWGPRRSRSRTHLA